MPPTYTDEGLRTARAIRQDHVLSLVAQGRNQIPGVLTLGRQALAYTSRISTVHGVTPGSAGSG
jgi:hypothetical protein